MRVESMNHLYKTSLFSASLVISGMLIHSANAQDLFDDAFLAGPADSTAPVPAAETVAPAPLPAEATAPAIPAETPVSAPVEAAPASAEIPNNTGAPVDFPPVDNLPPPAELPAMPDFGPAPAVPEASGPAPAMPDMSFGAVGSGAEMKLSQQPNDAVIGKVTSDIFREMAEVERENNNLALQLKREELKAQLNTLKAKNREVLFNEIQEREKMTQARLEWELQQDLKRQEALERKQNAEIRQKQIEAALKAQEDRRIEQMKREEAERKAKEEAEQRKIEAEKEELKKKYEAASIVRLNSLKPTLIEAVRPQKIKRVPSERVSTKLTESGEELLLKKNNGEELKLGLASGSENDMPKIDPASQLYGILEISGVGNTLVAKILSKKDNSTFYVKKNQTLPTGHQVLDIKKDFVLVQYGKLKEMIGFQAVGIRDVPRAEMPVIPEAKPVEQPKEAAPTAEAPKKPVRRGRRNRGSSTEPMTK